MTPEQLRQLIAAGESWDVDFKGEERQHLSGQELVETVICVANRRGGEPGWLLVGVEDDGRITGRSRDTSPASLTFCECRRSSPAGRALPQSGRASAAESTLTDAPANDARSSAAHSEVGCPSTGSAREPGGGRSARSPRRAQGASTISEPQPIVAWVRKPPTCVSGGSSPSSRSRTCLNRLLEARQTHSRGPTLFAQWSTSIRLWVV